MQDTARREDRWVGKSFTPRPCVLATGVVLIRKPVRPLQSLPLYPESCILYRVAPATLGPPADTACLQLAACSPRLCFWSLARRLALGILWLFV